MFENFMLNVIHESVLADIHI